MIIVNQKEYEKVKHKWKYRGECFDIHSGKVYMFCSNSIDELKEFKNSKSMLGMRYLKNEENPKYKVVKRLLENEQ